MEKLLFSQIQDSCKHVMYLLQDTFGAAADAWDEDGHEELAKTFQDGAGANDFFDLGNNDLGKKCQNIPEKCLENFKNVLT